MVAIRFRRSILAMVAAAAGLAGSLLSPPLQAVAPAPTMPSVPSAPAARPALPGPVASTGTATVAGERRKARRGVLKVAMAGLTSGQRAVVVITGPRNFSKTIGRNTTLRRLRPGVYTLRPRVVAGAGQARSFTAVSRTAKVKAGKTQKITVTYRSTGKPADGGSNPGTSTPGTNPPTVTPTPPPTSTAPVADRDELGPNEALRVGQSMRSPDGDTRLVMQPDGNLVLYNQNNVAKWSTGTSGSGNWAVMQTDGNLVVYNSANKPLWEATTGDFGTARLVLQNDGNLVIYQGSRALWSALGGVNYDRLAPGEVLQAGEVMKSVDFHYRLVMQGDGNLVLYNSSNVAQWSTTTSGSGNWAVMQTDGNLVVYDSANKPLWEATTGDFGTARLVLQNNGNLVIYQGSRALWSALGGVKYDRLAPGEVLQAGEVMKSVDFHYRLVMQGDGNLVLYNSSNVAQWSTTTSGSGNWAVMQTDGNFVVYNRANVALWSTTSSGSGSTLRLQTDGNLVVYRGGAALWSRFGRPSSAVDQFVNKYDQKYVDVDGVFGAQCVDLFNLYHREIVGGTHNIIMGGNGGALNLWTSGDPEVASRYTKVGPTAPAQKGDVAVWGPLPGWPPYGHVAIVVQDLGGSLALFSQNPGPAHQMTMSKAHLLGYLRPR